MKSVGIEMGQVGSADSLDYTIYYLLKLKIHVVLRIKILYADCDLLSFHFTKNIVQCFSWYYTPQ